MKKSLSTWEKLVEAETKAYNSKFQKLMRLPIIYPVVMAFTKAVYPVIKKEWYKKVTPFFGTSMTIALPSGADILFNGIKSHDSEIRLSKFLVRQLKPGDNFIDIGAHHGYYSLLASSLVGGGACFLLRLLIIHLSCFVKIWRTIPESVYSIMLQEKNKEKLFFMNIPDLMQSITPQ